MSITNLWHVLDIPVRQRVYCAHWTKLNDPLEGYYELYLRSKDPQSFARAHEALKANRDRHRIASFSANPSKFLLWSHYADGHKGVALEVDIDTEDPCLIQIIYSDSSVIFNEASDLTQNHPSVFRGKTPEWEYEEEWRIVTNEEYYSLEKPCARVLLGSLVPPDKRETLRRILPEQIELVGTKVNRASGRIEVMRDGG